MIEEIRKMVEERERKALNIDNWALYMHPQDRVELYEEVELPDPVGEPTKVPFEDIVIIQDKQIEEPTILPKRPDLMPSDLEFQEHPPYSLVKQMIEPEGVEVGINETRQEVVFQDVVEYEIRTVVYEVPLDKMEEAMSNPELEARINQAYEDSEWTASVDEREEVWRLVRDFPPGHSIHRVPIKCTGDPRIDDNYYIREMIAEEAIDLIGGEITKTLTAHVERRKEEETEGPHIVQEPSIPDEMDFETIREEVDVGTKTIELGRMRLK